APSYPPASPFSLSLHDALPIFTVPGQQSYPINPDFFMVIVVRFGNYPVLKPITPYELESRPLDQGIPTHYLVVGRDRLTDRVVRSEEHTSELQSRENLVCRHPP